MLDGILGRGFSSKCKSLLKLTRSRIEVIKRKRKATLKFLRKDMADLLANGLDTNAYGRAEGLLAELTLSECYQYLDYACDFLLRHLTVMEKINHCPEDCREAVSSLMFAAARFSDLPELRDLRQLFCERYDNSLEVFANRQFVEDMSSKPFTLEKKIQLMENIASEFSINWDSAAHKKKMINPSPVCLKDPLRTNGNSHANDFHGKSVKGTENSARSDRDDYAIKQNLLNDKYGLRSEKENDFSRLKPPIQTNHNSYYAPDNELLSASRKETKLQHFDVPKEDVSRAGGNQRNRVEKTDDKPSLQERKDHNSTKGDYFEATAGDKHGRYGRSVSNIEGKHLLNYALQMKDSSYSGSSSQKNKVDIVDDHCDNHLVDQRKLRDEYRSALPPPYTKPNHQAKIICDNKVGISRSEIPVVQDNVFREKEPVGTARDNGRQDRYNGMAERQGVATSRHGFGSRRDESSFSVSPPPRPRSSKDREDAYYGRKERQGVVVGREADDSSASVSPLPRHRSSRRRQTKSRANNDYLDSGDDGGLGKRRHRGRRRDETRQGLQILFDDDRGTKDDEEKFIDKLLLHYSKKPSSAEPVVLNRQRRQRNANAPVIDTKGRGNEDVADEVANVPPPHRASSLPHDAIPHSGSSKTLTRAATFQPDGSGVARHVHPKLPDYDDLAAKFAALKGR